MAALLQRKSLYARAYPDRCHVQGKDKTETLQYAIKILQPNTCHVQVEDKADTLQYTMEFLQHEMCHVLAKDKTGTLQYTMEFLQHEMCHVLAIDKTGTLQYTTKSLQSERYHASAKDRILSLGTKHLSKALCSSGLKGFESIYYSIPFLTKDKRHSTVQNKTKLLQPDRSMCSPQTKQTICSTQQNRCRYQNYMQVQKKKF